MYKISDLIALGALTATSTFAHRSMANTPSLLDLLTSLIAHLPDDCRPNDLICLR